MTLWVLTWTREALKAAQLGLFGGEAEIPEKKPARRSPPLRLVATPAVRVLHLPGAKLTSDPSHGGQLHTEQRTDVGGRTQARWIAAPEPDAAPEALPESRPEPGPNPAPGLDVAPETQPEQSPEPEPSAAPAPVIPSSFPLAEHFGRDNPPRFLGLRAEMFPYRQEQNYRTGYKDAIALRNDPFLESSGWYGALKGRKGDYWPLNFHVKLIGKQPSEKQAPLYEGIDGDLCAWWTGLDDATRERFIAEYANPVKQDMPGASGAGAKPADGRDPRHEDAALELPPGMEKMAARGWKLHAYQAKAVNFVAKHARRAIWNMEMGLGKTIAALALFHHMKAQGKVTQMIVTAPLSAINSWRKDAERTSDARMGIAAGLTPSKRAAVYRDFEAGKIDVLVTTPDSMASDAAELGRLVDRNPSAVLRIADEVHLYKSPTARRTKAWQAVLGGNKPGYVVGMTGTVKPNGSEDLYHVIDAVSPKKLGWSVWTFAARFCSIHEINIGGGRTAKEIGGFDRKKLDELRRELDDTMFSRTLADPDVEIALPKRHDIAPEIEPDAHQQKITTLLGKYMKLRRKLNRADQIHGDDWRTNPRLARPSPLTAEDSHEAMGGRGTDLATIEARNRIALHGLHDAAEHYDRALRGELGPDHQAAAMAAPTDELPLIIAAQQIAIDPRLVHEGFKAESENYESPKVAACADAIFAHMQNHPDKAVLALTSFLGGMSVLKAALLRRGFAEHDLGMYSGSTSEQARSKLVDGTNSGATKVLIAQNTAMMTGANLQERANMVVHLDTPWRPDVLSQSTARVYRQGQRHVTVVFRPVGSNVERKIEAKVASKIAETEAATGKRMVGEAKLAATMEPGGGRSPLTLDELLNHFGAGGEE